MRTILDKERTIYEPPELGCMLCLNGLPAGGAYVHDKSSYGNHDSITGAVWKKLPSGLWCLDFDGGDDFVSVTHSPSLNFSQQISVLAWVKRNAWAQAGGIARKKEEWGVQNAWTGSPGYAAGKFEFHLMVGGTDTHFCSNTVGIDGVWYALVATYDGSNMKIYLNGLLDNTKPQTGSIGSSANSLKIGEDGYGNYFNGQIALVRVFNRPLVALEIQNVFNREKSLFGVWI